MITEIITTGTELLLGELDNENSRYLAELMNEHGFTVAFMTTVGDNPERMSAAFATALSRADLVITSGGLGSTQGDITKKIGAEVLGLPYVLFPEEAARLAAYYKEKGRPYLPSLSRQAWFAEGAELLRNEAGSASGCLLSHHGKLLVHLPGPPFEMKRMAEKHMLSSLKKRLGEMGTIRSMILPIPGRTEAEIEETIMDLILAQENPTIALLARPGYIALRVTAKAETAEAAYVLMAPLVTELRKRLPIADYHIEQHVREDLVVLLEKTHLSISAAESCTGGLIGKLMTDLPGSSAYFKGSAVTYWNEAKENVLGVSSETLSRYTAVSGETAKEMAEGSRRLYASDIAVSTTGYAGPGRGERGEPEGTVFIAVAGSRGTEVHEEHFLGSRKSVRYAAAEKAMYYVMEYVRKMTGEDREAFRIGGLGSKRIPTGDASMDFGEALCSNAK